MINRYRKVFSPVDSGAQHSKCDPAALSVKTHKDDCSSSQFGPLLSWTGFEKWGRSSDCASFQMFFYLSHDAIFRSRLVVLIKWKDEFQPTFNQWIRDLMRHLTFLFTCRATSMEWRKRKWNLATFKSSGALAHTLFHTVEGNLCGRFLSHSAQL